MGDKYTLDDANRDLLNGIDTDAYVNLQLLRSQDFVVLDGWFSIAELETVLTIAKRLKAAA